MKNGAELYKAICERRTNAQIRNDMKDFLQYILDQWELNTKEVQDRAEKLLNNMTERQTSSQYKLNNKGSIKYEYYKAT